MCKERARETDTISAINFSRSAIYATSIITLASNLVNLR